MFLPTKDALKRALVLSLSGTRGGLVRLDILLLLLEKSQNTNEMSKTLDMDYKSVQHHIRVLEKSSLITSSKKKYSNAYRLSTLLLSNKDVLEALKELGKSR